MTDRHREIAQNAGAVFIKNWLPAIIVGASVMMRIGSYEEKLTANIAEDLDHHKDRGLHMPYEEKVKQFVTRVEWQRIENQLEKIDLRQREILIIISRLEQDHKNGQQ